MAVSPQEFLDLAESFREVTPTKADQLLETEPGTTVFIGRETCPFCRTFMPKLHEVASEHDHQVYFVHSQHPDYTADLEHFRSKYDVPTVPGLLHNDGIGVAVKCESGMEPEEIKEFLEL